MIGRPANALLFRAERKLKSMTGTARAAAYMVAGLLLEIVGLIYTIRGKVGIGMMDIAVGAMCFAFAARRARRTQAADILESPPVKKEREH